METPTFLIALLFAAFAAYVRPGTAIACLFLSALVWPEYLRFPIGPVQMSAPRLVGIVLLTRLSILNGRRLVPNLTDKMVLGFSVWSVLSLILAGATGADVGSSIGRLLDTSVIYFVVRLAIRTKAELLQLRLPLLVLTVGMGALGLYEAIAGASPYQSLMNYHAWRWFDKEPEYRLGLLRARVSTSHYIYFGLAMFLIVGLLWALRPLARRSKFSPILHFASISLGIAGIFSSLSSGPYVAISSFFLLYMFIYQRKLIRPAWVGFIVLALLVEIASNRHFYHMVDYISLNSATAWYRTRLIEVAFSQLSEYWLVGVGSRSIDHWGTLIDGRRHVDLVNHFVYTAVSSGLPGLVLFVSIQVLTIRQAIKLQKFGDKSVRLFGFSLVCLIVALMIVSMSVSIFGPALIFCYILYGLPYLSIGSKESKARYYGAVGCFGAAPSSVRAGAGASFRKQDITVRPK